MEWPCECTKEQVVPPVAPKVTETSSTPATIAVKGKLSFPPARNSGYRQSYLNQPLPPMQGQRYRDMFSFTGTGSGVVTYCIEPLNSAFFHATDIVAVTKSGSPLFVERASIHGMDVIRQMLLPVNVVTPIVFPAFSVASLGRALMMEIRHDQQDSFSILFYGEARSSPC